MAEYRLQVFESFDTHDWSRKYRFAVINPNKPKGYPANFVCLLPKRIVDAGKPLSEFGRIFGEKSSEFAADLLKDALKQEKNEIIKIELEKRLKIIEPEQPKSVCSSCKKEYYEYSKIKYKHNLCKTCLELKFKKGNKEICPKPYKQPSRN
jgi:hypothetical protein